MSELSEVASQDSPGRASPRVLVVTELPSRSDFPMTKPSGLAPILGDASSAWCRPSPCIRRMLFCIFACGVNTGLLYGSGVLSCVPHTPGPVIGAGSLFRCTELQMGTRLILWRSLCLWLRSWFAMSFLLLRVFVSSEQNESMFVLCLSSSCCCQGWLEPPDGLLLIDFRSAPVAGWLENRRRHGSKPGLALLRLGRKPSSHSHSACRQ